ncbi:MAG: divalent cation tolerance protein CutA, partial [Gemmatimonadota bacterium]
MTPDPPEAASIVSTTVDDEAVARRIAETLVEERLAACVQLL